MSYNYRFRSIETEELEIINPKNEREIQKSILSVVRRHLSVAIYYSS